VLPRSPVLSVFCLQVRVLVLPGLLQVEMWGLLRLPGLPVFCPQVLLVPQWPSVWELPLGLEFLSVRLLELPLVRVRLSLVSQWPKVLLPVVRLPWRLVAVGTAVLVLLVCAQVLLVSQWPSVWGLSRLSALPVWVQLPLVSQWPSVWELLRSPVLLVFCPQVLLVSQWPSVWELPPELAFLSVRLLELPLVRARLLLVPQWPEVVLPVVRPPWWLVAVGTAVLVLLVRARLRLVSQWPEVVLPVAQQPVQLVLPLLGAEVAEYHPLGSHFAH
jgi:hypothetical protein